MSKTARHIFSILIALPILAVVWGASGWDFPPSWSVGTWSNKLESNSSSVVSISVESNRILIMKGLPTVQVYSFQLDDGTCLLEEKENSFKVLEPLGPDTAYLHLQRDSFKSKPVLLWKLKCNKLNYPKFIKSAGYVLMKE